MTRKTAIFIEFFRNHTSIQQILYSLSYFNKPEWLIRVVSKTFVIIFGLFSLKMHHWRFGLIVEIFPANPSLATGASVKSFQYLNVYSNWAKSRQFCWNALIWRQSGEWNAGNPRCRLVSSAVQPNCLLSVGYRGHWKFGKLFLLDSDQKQTEYDETPNCCCSDCKFRAYLTVNAVHQQNWDFVIFGPNFSTRH